MMFKHFEVCSYLQNHQHKDFLVCSKSLHSKILRQNTQFTTAILFYLIFTA